MKGLTGMMASMLGMTPEEIEASVEEVKKALFSMAEGVGKIHAQNIVIHDQNKEILERLERIENGTGKSSAAPRLGNGNRRKSGDSGSGDAGNAD